MITSVKISGGKDLFLKNLPIRAKKFQFTPGLNILFGPNGSGKSTIIKTLGALTMLRGMMNGSILDGGNGMPQWGFGHTPSLNMEPSKRAEIMPDFLFRLGVVKREHGLEQRRGRGRTETTAYPISKSNLVRVALEWDRQPTFTVEGSGSFRNVSYFGESEYGFTEELGRMRSQARRSSGELQAERLTALMGQAHKVAVPYYTGPLRANEVWRDRCKIWNEWIDGFSEREGGRTLLLDEPDISLSAPIQKALFEELARIAETGQQIIVATHSPWSLVHGAVLDTEPGYADVVRGSVRDLAERMEVASPS